MTVGEWTLPIGWRYKYLLVGRKGKERYVVQSCQGCSLAISDPGWGCCWNLYDVYQPEIGNEDSASLKIILKTYENVFFECIYICIYIYIYIYTHKCLHIHNYSGGCGIIIIVLGNLGDPNSNSWQGCLHFILYLGPWKRYSSNYSPSSVNSRANWALLPWYGNRAWIKKTLNSNLLNSA